MRPASLGANATTPWGAPLQNRSRAAMAATLVVLAIPATAGAATKPVQLGLPASSQKTFQNKYGSDVNAFFPHDDDDPRRRLGEVLAAAASTPSTSRPRAAAPRRSSSRPASRSPARTTPPATPFWFNGQDHARLQPGAADVRLFGKTVSYNGAKRIESRRCRWRQAQADDGQVHQGRHVHVLLRHPPGHEGHGQGVKSKRQACRPPRPTQAAVKRQVARRLKTAAKLPQDERPGEHGRRRRLRRTAGSSTSACCRARSRSRRARR